MKLAFLHTAASHVDRFSKIIREADAEIEVKHFVNERLLTSALLNNQGDEADFKAVIQNIRQEGFDNIICTCSSYGELCEAEEKVYRIDRPVVNLIIKNFSKIGVAFTVETTKEISKKLLIDTAARASKKVEIIEINCKDCWRFFEAGEPDEYAFAIAEQIKSIAGQCEVVLLAQASMEGAKTYLSNEKYQVLSSPELGVRKYMELIKKSLARH